MRVLIASDIHGRINSARKLEAAFLRVRPARMILLGDYLYNGPRNGVPYDYDPMGVAVILNKFASLIIGVRGNCDSRIDESLLHWSFADSRVININGFRCDLIHGDLLTSEIVSVERGDILMYGHTHVPMLKKTDGVVYFNPGSVAFPKQDYPPSYGLMDGEHLEIRSLNDDQPLMQLDLF